MLRTPVPMYACCIVTAGKQQQECNSVNVWVISQQCHDAAPSSSARQNVNNTQYCRYYHSTLHRMKLTNLSKVLRCMPTDKFHRWLKLNSAYSVVHFWQCRIQRHFWFLHIQHHKIFSQQCDCTVCHLYRKVGPKLFTTAHLTHLTFVSPFTITITWITSTNERDLEPQCNKWQTLQ